MKVVIKCEDPHFRWFGRKWPAPTVVEVVADDAFTSRESEGGYVITLSEHRHLLAVQGKHPVQLCKLTDKLEQTVRQQDALTTVDREIEERNAALRTIREETERALKEKDSAARQLRSARSKLSKAKEALEATEQRITEASSNRRRSDSGS